MYSNRKSMALSGGCKRRLSLALSMIGCPRVLLLDEPTTGVDAVARRCLWNILLALKQQSNAIILTSHRLRHELRAQKKITFHFLAWKNARRCAIMLPLWSMGGNDASAQHST